MKKITLLFCLCLSTFMYSQSNEEIASIYIKRAEKNFNDQNTSEAVKAYTKAMKYIDLDQNSDISIPKLGMILFANVNNFVKAKEYSKNYFKLVTDKTTDEYLNMLELYVDIVDNIEESEGTTSASTPTQVAQTKNVSSTNSSNTVRSTSSNSKPVKYSSSSNTNTSSVSTQPEEVVSERIKTSYTPRKEGGYTQQELAEDRAYPSTIIADRTYPFNANGIAVFEKSGRLGLINDQGRVFLYPEEYTDYVQYDGYIILKNRKNDPSKLYCFNSNINFGFILPPVREFNSLSSSYGTVMKPRGNGILVTYPNNSLDVLKFDLNRGEFIKRPSAIDLVKNLEELGEVDIEYRVLEEQDLLEVKMSSEWVVLGSPLGGDIYPLFRRNDYSIYGYAFNKSDGESEKRVMRYLGSYYDGKIQASTSKESWWLDKRSRSINTEEIKVEKYKGDAEIIRVSAGTYKVQRIAGKQ